ncbi:hypothetical protein LTR53_019479, partial [Teratosphaeriaceae sp. CCFEE 6253]
MLRRTSQPQPQGAYSQRSSQYAVSQDSQPSPAMEQAYIPQQQQGQMPESPVAYHQPAAVMSPLQGQGQGQGYQAMPAPQQQQQPAMQPSYTLPPAPQQQQQPPPQQAQQQ